MNIDILYFVVTGVGVLLTLFSLVFICLGKKITGSDGQEIEYGGLKARTNSILTLLIVSVVTTAFPLYLYNSGEIKQLREENKKLILEIQKNDKNPPDKPPIEEVDPRVDLSGYYDYRSTPRNKRQGLLIDEEGNKFYQFIGEIEIRKDPGNKSYSIKAHRYYVILQDKSQLLERAGPRLKKLDDFVEWTADSNNVYYPQLGAAEIIFSIETKKTPPNQGLIKGSIKETMGENGNKKAKIIEGEMTYLIPANPLRNTGPHWMMATMTLQRKADQTKMGPDAPNHFKNKQVYEEWFRNYQ